MFFFPKKIQAHHTNCYTGKIDFVKIPTFYLKHFQQDVNLMKYKKLSFHSCFIYIHRSPMKCGTAKPNTSPFSLLYLRVFITDPVKTDLVNALPGNNSVNTAQHATICGAVFSMSSAPSNSGITGSCKPLPGNGSVNTFPCIGPCYKSGDVINNRDGVFRSVCAECL
jgi:hypothetical protein